MSSKDAKLTQRAHMTTLCLDLYKPAGADSHAIEDALLDLEITEQLRRYAMQLMQQRGGPLAGVIVLSRIGSL